MDADRGAAAAGYLSEFARTLQRVEITARGGAALSTDAGIAAIVGALVSVRDERRKALLIGNGGSAAGYGCVEMAHSVVAHCISDFAAVQGAVSPGAGLDTRRSLLR